MRVVSNTSPISYLVILNQIELLPLLFGAVTIPDIVRGELSAQKAPLDVREWIAAPPAWLTIQSVTARYDVDLMKVDAGERAAISLAEEIEADLVLLDDLEARLLASKRGLTITGVLGILDRAANRREINFAAVIDHLQKTNFRTSSAIVRALLDKHRS